MHHPRVATRAAALRWCRQTRRPPIISQRGNAQAVVLFHRADDGRSPRCCGAALVLVIVYSYGGRCCERSAVPCPQHVGAARTRVQSAPPRNAAPRTHLPGAHPRRLRLDLAARTINSIITIISIISIIIINSTRHHHERSSGDTCHRKVNVNVGRRLDHDRHDLNDDLNEGVQCHGIVLIVQT